MVTWVRAHQVGFWFLASLIVGLAFIAASAFTVSTGLGLLVTGVCFVGAGHWVTYLNTATTRGAA